MYALRRFLWRSKSMPLFLVSIRSRRCDSLTLIWCVYSILAGCSFQFYFCYSGSQEAFSFSVLLVSEKVAGFNFWGLHHSFAQDGFLGYVPWFTYLLPFSGYSTPKPAWHDRQIQDHWQSRLCAHRYVKRFQVSFSVPVLHASFSLWFFWSYFQVWNW